MSFLAALLLLVCLSLSMHACNARHLRIKMPSIVARQLELGVAEKKIPDSSSILSRPSSLFISKDFQAEKLQNDQQVRNNGITGIMRSMPEIIAPFRENHLQRQAAEVEEIQERSIRFTSESSQGKHDDATTVDSKDSGDSVVEDVVVMDYAQPHRKPPIHNEKN